ncbi:hypothetical protein EMO92_04570 [Bifidobacterium reuteri]|uniref:Type II toxin-antitoxin system HicA family toxin n=1 Tax=Bifidobacterium reuteri TaxID=983706 RepID=A0A5J5E8V6_9BIFI|nr:MULTISPECIES: hypothetical protein [Bifidobacterium]KAA8825742.1 hypothetical protein EMO92_04570 [Bifidobacterium reuteri]TPF92171.1 hypothetical protein BW14_09880 [Bifidobacterium sp. UTBIF-68]
MTKRKDIIKRIKAEAKKNGCRLEILEGGNHSKLVIDGMIVPLPRHNEIRENTTKAIYGECEPKFGKDWWK